MQQSLAPDWIGTVARFNPVDWAVEAGRSATFETIDWALVAGRIGLLGSPGRRRGEPRDAGLRRVSAVALSRCRMLRSRVASLIGVVFEAVVGDAEGGVAGVEEVGVAVPSFSKAWGVAWYWRLSSSMTSFCFL